jgi:RNA ligase
MRYEFPQKIEIDEVRGAIARANERLGLRSFIEADRSDHVIFNYVVAMSDSFPALETGNPTLDREYAILRECRGLTFRKGERHQAKAKFHKFWNLNEKPETQMGLVDWSAPHTVLSKLDGSMITPFIRSLHDVEWHTKMGHTDVALPVCAFVQASRIDYNAGALALDEQGYTPIFEWCSRQKRIVVDYVQEALVLTAIRSRVDGRYMDVDAMRAVASQYGLPMVEASDPVSDPTLLLEAAQGLTGAEGWVIRFADGHALKVKGAEYLRMHRIKSEIAQEKDLLWLIVEDKLDDAIAAMHPADADAANAYARVFHRGISSTARQINEIVENARKAGVDRKTFAMSVASKEAPNIRHALFQVWDGKDAEVSIRQVVSQNLSTQNKVDAVRPLWGEARWTTSIDIREL